MKKLTTLLFSVSIFVLSNILFMMVSLTLCLDKWDILFKTSNPSIEQQTTIIIFLLFLIMVGYSATISIFRDYLKY